MVIAVGKRRLEAWGRSDEENFATALGQLVDYADEREVAEKEARGNAITEIHNAGQEFTGVYNEAVEMLNKMNNPELWDQFRKQMQDLSLAMSKDGYPWGKVLIDLNTGSISLEFGMDTEAKVREFEADNEALSAGRLKEGAGVIKDATKTLREFVAGKKSVAGEEKSAEIERLGLAIGSSISKRPFDSLVQNYDLDGEFVEGSEGVDPSYQVKDKDRQLLFQIKVRGNVDQPLFVLEDADGAELKSSNDKAEIRNELEGKLDTKFPLSPEKKARRAFDPALTEFMGKNKSQFPGLSAVYHDSMLKVLNGESVIGWIRYAEDTGIYSSFVKNGELRARNVQGFFNELQSVLEAQ